MKVSQAKKLVKNFITLNESGEITQRHVPYIIGAPGSGKTMLVKQVADELKYAYMPISLSMRDIGEIAGMPDKAYDEKAKVYYMTRILATYLKDAIVYSKKGKGVIIFYDELNRAPEFVLNSALPILLEGRIDDVVLPSNVHFIAAGNLGVEDDTNVQELDAAMWDRLQRIHIEPDLEEWFEYMGNRLNHLVYTYLHSHPDSFSDIKNSVEDIKIKSPRTWERLSEYLNYFGAENMLEMGSEGFAMFLPHDEARAFYLMVKNNFINLVDAMENPEIINTKMKAAIIVGDVQRRIKWTKTELKKMIGIIEHLTNMSEKDDEYENFLLTIITRLVSTTTSSQAEFLITSLSQRAIEHARKITDLIGKGSIIDDILKGGK